MDLGKFAEHSQQFDSIDLRAPHYEWRIAMCLPTVRSLTLAFLAVTFIGCGGPSAELSQAQERVKEQEAEIASLKAELEELKFGASRLLAQARAAAQNAQYEDAKKLLAELEKRHPAAPENTEAAPLLKEMQRRTDEAARLAAAQLAKKEEDARLALERATRNMARENDEIKGITWIRHKNAPVLGKFVSLYFGSKDGSAKNYPLRMKVEYSGEDWLFVKSLTVKADDKVYELGPLDFERDNSAGTIWEWVDLPVEDMAMLNQWLTAGRVVVRYNGDKYYHDLTLPSSQRDQMKDVLEAWRGMGGGS